MRIKKILLLLFAVPLLFLAWYSLSLPGRETQKPEAVVTEAAPEAPAEPTPEATPEPEPTPEPTPTPRPLSPAALSFNYIDPELYAPIEQKGELIYLDYETKDYHYGTEGPYAKRMMVYLPYGYDVSQRYNVLFLLHPSGLDQYFWLPGELPYEQFSLTMTDLLDNMVARGLIEPTIVVAPSGYITDTAWQVHDSVRDYDQFGHEFANEIMPLVTERLATYAEGSERAQIAAAREHFGVAGASFGSYMARNSVLGPNLDLCANYAMIGGGSLRQDDLRNEWAAAGRTPDTYPIHRLIVVEGELDDRLEPERSYHALREWTDVFSADNLSYELIAGATHDSREWINGVFNAAQLFFRDDIPMEVAP